MWTRVGLRVVLHAESPLTGDLKALANTIVQVDVCHRGLTKERVGVDREVVVLTRDLDAIGQKILDWMISAVVAEWQLHRSGTNRLTE